MISFLTLLLGLTIGPQKVEVSVSGPVAAVEFRLDGAAVARLEHAPWSATVDLGTDLSPHELTARGLGASGEELSRARQWINLPRPPAEIEILLERDASGKATAARLAPVSLVGPKPAVLLAAFDDKPLAVREGGRVDLPAYDGGTTHLLTATAEFSNGVLARRDAVLGGAAATEASAELTGVPVRVNGRPPMAAAAAGWFVKNGEPLSPVAFEHSGAQILIVRDLTIDEARARVGSRETRSRSLAGKPIAEAIAAGARLDREDRARFLWPVVQVSWGGDLRTELFEGSHDFLLKEEALPWLLTHIEDPHPAAGPPRYADAVAVAGLQAAASRGRRAVILVLGSQSADGSHLSPASARRYLERLRVPLYIWSLTGPSGPAAEWGEREDISNPALLRRACGRLKDALETQWIAWLSGEHRPQDITLSREARGVALLP
jgi:hypothetical protein